MLITVSLAPKRVPGTWLKLNIYWINECVLSEFRGSRIREGWRKQGGLSQDPKDGQDLEGSEGETNTDSSRAWPIHMGKPQVLKSVSLLFEKQISKAGEAQYPFNTCRFL